MLIPRILAAATTCLFLFAGGCGSAPSGDNEPSGGGNPSDGNMGSAGTQREIIVMNGNDPLLFWQSSTQEALRALAKGPLESAVGALGGTPLTESAGGRRLLGYVVTCALAEGEVLHGATPGASFEGAVGLAPQWASAPLDSEESQRWVTACLLQTLNGLGMEVQIRMSGSHPELADDGSGTGASDFSVPESTMFGNIFLSAGSATYACVDSGIPSCGMGWSAHALQRICGLSPTCGILTLGLCDLSCDRDSAGHATCTGRAGDRYAEAISTTLQKSGFVSLYGDCGP